MSEALSWFERNEAQVREVVEELKIQHPKAAVYDNDVVVFLIGEEEMALTIWDAAVALSVILGIPIEYA